MPSSPLRTHDVVLAEGTFRIVLTDKRRVAAVIDAPATALGPLHIVFAIDRTPFLPEGVSPVVLAPGAVTGFDFGHVLGDVGQAIGHAAEGAFNAASHALTTAARPVFDVLKGAASEGLHFIAHTVPFLHDADRRKLDAAARTILRARLGDLSAKQFIHGIAEAAKAGGHVAQTIGDTLLDASKTMAHLVDVPTRLLEHVPGVGDIAKTVSPFETWGHMSDAIKQGDFHKLEGIAKRQLSLAQGVLSLIPGIGTGVSSALAAGLALLEGGSPLEIAIHAAYGAIPIPPGLRQVTDTVLDAVIDLAFHAGGGLTDVAIHVARDRAPTGLPRDVFDTLIQLVVHHQPVERVAGGLVDHFVRQYAPAGAGIDLSRALAGASSHLPGAAGALSRSPIVLPGGWHPAAAHAPPPQPRMVQPLHHAAHA
jgi:hypothetical protein